MDDIKLSQKIHIGLVKQSGYIITTLIANSLLIFYTDYIGLQNVLLFGLAILIFGFWNAVNDPLFGYFSDVRVSKGKKRIPLIKLGMPIMLIGFFMIIFVARGTDDWTIFFILLFGLIIFDFGKALSMVNYDAYCITIADNPKERAKLNMIISYVGLVPGALVGIVPIYFLTGDFVYIEILFLFLILVLSFFIISYYSLVRLEEPSHIYYSLGDENSPSAFTLWEAFSQTLSSKSFIILLVFRFVAFFFQGIYYQNIIFMMKWVVPTRGIMTLLLAGLGGLMMNAFYPLWTKLQSKYGTVKSLQFCFLMGVPGYVIMFFATNFCTLTLGYVISTLSLSGLFFEPVLIGEVTDDDFVKTGNRKQGMFVSIYGFFNTLSYSLTIFLFTALLAYFQYNGTLESQSEYTIFGLRFIACIIPLIAVIVCVLIIQFFPIQGERHRILRARIEELQSNIDNKSEKVDS